MPSWSVIDIADVPTVHGDSDDPVWHPLQHFFGITAREYVAVHSGVRPEPHSS